MSRSAISEDNLQWLPQSVNDTWVGLATPQDSFPPDLPTKYYIELQLGEGKDED